MRIATFYQSSPQHLKEIQSVADGIELVGCTSDSLGDDLCQADIFMGHVKAPVDWQAVVEAGRLKWIQSSAAGLDHCLVPEVVGSNITVSSASGLFANQVAEQTMALLLGLLRRLHVFFEAKTRREYVRKPTDDLHGKTIGLVGAGGNGQRIASLLAAFNCRIVATDLFHDQRLASIDELFPPKQLDSVLQQSEVLIVTAPLTEATRGLVDATTLSQLPQGAYLINVGRGEIVNEEALVDALAEGKLAGAGLDVAEVEPLPVASPLWSMSQVIISPHVGAQSQRRNDDATRLFCKNLTRYLQGRPLINQVDKQLGFPLPGCRFSTWDQLEP